MSTYAPSSEVVQVILNKIVEHTAISVDTTPFSASNVIHLSITEKSIDTAIKDLLKLLPGSASREYTIKLHVENEEVLTYEPRSRTTKVGHPPHSYEVTTTYKRKKD